MAQSRGSLSVSMTFRGAPRPTEIANNSVNYIVRATQFNKYICPNSLVALKKIIPVY